MEFVSQILQIVLEAVLPVLVVTVIGWVMSKAREVEARIDAVNPEIAEVVTDFARLAVKAAEQIYGSKTGQQKKQYAVDAVNLALKNSGLILDFGVIETAVEAAVYENFGIWDAIHARSEAENGE